MAFGERKTPKVKLCLKKSTLAVKGQDIEKYFSFACVLLTVPIRTSHFTLMAHGTTTAIITTLVFVSHFCSSLY